MYKLLPSFLILMAPFLIVAAEFTNVPMKEKGTATYYITAKVAGYNVDLLGRHRRLLFNPQQEAP